MNKRSAQLRALLERPGIVVLPGAYDCLSARLAEQAGFETVFTTGFGFAASALGVPDLGLMTASEILDRVHNIVQSVQVPLVADMDTGYGNPLNVIRTVSECVGSGCGRDHSGRPGMAEEMRALGRQARDSHGRPRAEVARCRGCPG